MRTERYNLIWYIIAHDRQLHTYVDDEISGGGRPIPKNATTEWLEALGDTLNFIYFLIKLFHRNYEERHMIYHEDMKNLFKQIPTIKSKPLSHNKKHQKLLTDIGGRLYMGKWLRDYHKLENKH